MNTLQKRTWRVSVPFSDAERDQVRVASEASGLPVARLMRLAALRLADELAAPGARPAGLILGPLPEPSRG